MIKVIVTGHGHFASGIKASIEQLMGEQEDVVYIDFSVSMGSDDLNQIYQKEVAVNSDDSVLFFCDLLGGTPFRIASTIATTKNNIEVIAGTNLQMLIQSFLDRDDLGLNEIVEQALDIGRLGITSLSEQLQQKTNNNHNNNDFDGI